MRMIIETLSRFLISSDLQNVCLRRVQTVFSIDLEPLGVVDEDDGQEFFQSLCMD